MTQPQRPSGDALQSLIATVHRLRAPGGCPWDRAQTHQSLRQYLIEEAYEVLDILDQVNTPEDLKKQILQASFKEELGDLFMQVLLHSEIAQESGFFSIYDVAQGLEEKLIRRHPHVFGTEKAGSAEGALQNWEKEKAKEKQSQPNASILDGVPKGLPTLQRAARVLEKVTRVGFQWKDMTGPLEKVDEELEELKHEIREFEKGTQSEFTSELIQKRIESELGDLLFTLCNVAYLMKINPEDSLRGTLSRFEKRFNYIERKIKQSGKTIDQSNLEEMDSHWSDAKKIEKAEIWGLTGGIASGKSSAARFFSELGIPVVDADEIARSIMKEQGPAYQTVLEHFGTTDRSQLRELIFNNPQKKKELEAILHPYIQVESRKQIESLATKHPIVIYEASLLIETGKHKDLQGLILVEAPNELRIKRLMSRPGISEDLANKIIISQLPSEKQIAHANEIFENTKEMDDLRAQVRHFAERKGWLKSKTL